MTMGRGGVFGKPYQFGMKDPFEQFMPKKPVGTGGVFGGQFDDDPTAMPAPQQPEKRWLEGGKFGWKDGLALALGAIGDARTGRPQTSQMILGSMQQRRQAEERQRLFEQQRKAGLEDYRTQKQIDQEYAAPPKATAFQQDYEYILRNFGPEAAEKFRNNKVDPPEYRQGADGRFYRVEVGQPQVLGSTLPAGWTLGN